MGVSEPKPAQGPDEDRASTTGATATSIANNRRDRFAGIDFSAPRSKSARRFRFFLKPVATAAFRLFGRRIIVGAENIPASGAAILAPNHRSYIDTPLLTIGVARNDLWFMAKEGIYFNRLWAWFFYACGSFPVVRDGFDRKAIKYSLAVLGRDELLVVYPEGRREEGPEVKPLLDGVLWIAARTGVPIIPVGIGGSHKMMSLKDKYPRRARTAIVFGSPITVGVTDGKRVERTELQAQAQELREQIQQVYDQAQVLAGTPNASNT